jgi:hypothetical protein
MFQPARKLTRIRRGDRSRGWSISRPAPFQAEDSEPIRPAPGNAFNRPRQPGRLHRSRHSRQSCFRGSSKKIRVNRLRRPQDVPVFSNRQPGGRQLGVEPAEAGWRLGRGVDELVLEVEIGNEEAWHRNIPDQFVQAFGLHSYTAARP